MSPAKSVMQGHKTQEICSKNQNVLKDNRKYNQFKRIGTVLAEFRGEGMVRGKHCSESEVGV